MPEVFDLLFKELGLIKVDGTFKRHPFSYLMEASDVKEFGDRMLPAKMVMTPVKKDGQQTMMITSKQSFNVDIDQGFFSQQNMKKVR